MNGMDLELLQGLPPEVLQQLMGLGGIPDAMGLEQQRMGFGQQLAKPSGHQYTSGQGAAIGGIADALRSFGGNFIQGQGLSAQQQLLGEQKAGREQYAKSIADFLRSRQKPTVPPVPVPSVGSISDAHLLEPLT